MAKRPLERAVDLVGGQSAFARLHGVSQPTVWAWLKQRKPLPAEYVLRTESETGISRHDLRPDLYPREQAAAA
jgi:DNA-binding transcriptional regulator YdaS (Cro superfamily)